MLPKPEWDNRSRKEPDSEMWQDEEPAPRRRAGQCLKDAWDFLHPIAQSLIVLAISHVVSWVFHHVVGGPDIAAGASPFVWWSDW